VWQKGHDIRFPAAGHAGSKPVTVSLNVDVLNFTHTIRSVESKSISSYERFSAGLLIGGCNRGRRRLCFCASWSPAHSYTVRVYGRRRWGRRAVRSVTPSTKSSGSSFAPVGPYGETLAIERRARVPLYLPQIVHLRTTKLPHIVHEG
jgi:hypothetical protein